MSILREDPVGLAQGAEHGSRGTGGGIALMVTEDEETGVGVLRAGPGGCGMEYGAREAGMALVGVGSHSTISV